MVASKIMITSFFILYSKIKKQEESNQYTWIKTKFEGQLQIIQLIPKYLPLIMQKIIKFKLSNYYYGYLMFQM